MRATFPIVCVSIAMLLWPITASARCPSLTFKQSAAFSPVVVRGRPVATRREITIGKLRAGFMVTTFAVEGVWKGRVPSTVHLYELISHDALDVTRYLDVDLVVFGQELTSEERDAFRPPDGIVALSIVPCASKPAREGNVAALGPSRPPTDVR